MLLTHLDLLSLKIGNNADEILPCNVFSEEAKVWQVVQRVKTTLTDTSLTNNSCVMESKWRLLPFDMSTWMQTCYTQDWTINGLEF